jgi:HEAT repeat protein
MSMPVEFQNFVGRDSDLWCKWYKIQRETKEIQEILEHPPSSKALVPLLTNEDPVVRRDAVRALGRFGDSDALQTLTRAMVDETMRVTVIKTLSKMGTRSAISLLITLLNDECAWVRKNAVKALWALGDAEATQAVFEALTDRTIQISVIETLDEIQGPQAIKPLLGLLTEDDPVVRRNAVRALEWLVDIQTIEPLVALLSDKDGGIRKKVAEILERVGWEPANEVLQLQYLIAHRQWDEIVYEFEGDIDCVKPLIALLADGDEDVRYGVAVALGSLGDLRAVKPLIQALTDEDENVRMVVAEVLGEIGDEQAVKPLIKALEDENWQVRYHAVLSLRSLGDPAAVPALCTVLEEDGNDAYVCRNAAEALDEFGWEPSNDILKAAYLMAKDRIDEAIEMDAAPFISIIEKRKEVGVPFKAIKILREIGDPQAVDPLIGLLTDKDEYIRLQSVITLGDLRDPRAVEPLINTLADKDRDVRTGAINALGQIGNARAVHALIDTAQDDPAAVEVLEKVRNPSAVDTLLAVLVDEKKDEAIRYSAAKALGELGDPQSVAPLIATLQDNSREIREWAAAALGKIRDARAVAPLIATLADENWQVRKRAVNALEDLGELAVNPLIATLRDDSKDARRRTALIDEDKDLRKSAAIALGRIGDTRAVEPLIASLKDEDEVVRKQVARALGWLGDSRAVEPLEKALKTENDKAAQRIILKALRFVRNKSEAHAPVTAAKQPQSSRKPHKKT